jgi:hypothetical protein
MSKLGKLIVVLVPIVIVIFSTTAIMISKNEGTWMHVKK